MASPSRNQVIKLISVSLIAVAFHYLFTPSSLGALEFPSPSSILHFPPNTKLQEVTKLGEGFLDRPEDVAVDGLGNLYTATRDGWIRRLSRNGSSWENLWHLETDGLAGLTIADNLFICDTHKGLLKAGEDGVEDVVSQINGMDIVFANDVVVTSDGMLYFTITSTKYNLSYWYLDMLDPISTGQLIQHDPSTNTTSMLLDHLGFANGIALSSKEDYLIVCETTKFRCLKYWLKGEKKGQTDIFIDNLPGGPDNINLAPDGSFWIALLQLKPRIWMKLMVELRAPDRVKIGLQNAIIRSLGIRNRGTVVNVGSDGKLIRGFDDPTGKVMAFVTSALEFEGQLYLGSMDTNFLGKLPLENPSPSATK